MHKTISPLLVRSPLLGSCHDFPFRCNEGIDAEGFSGSLIQASRDDSATASPDLDSQQGAMDALLGKSTFFTTTRYFVICCILAFGPTPYGTPAFSSVLLPDDCFSKLLPESHGWLVIVHWHVGQMRIPSEALTDEMSS